METLYLNFRCEPEQLALVAQPVLQLSAVWYFSLLEVEFIDCSV